MLKEEVINLGEIANIMNGDDRRCIYLIDKSGNSYTFFKYKGKLIDVHSLWVEVQSSKKTKQAAIQQIRKGLAYGISNGQPILFYISNSSVDWNQFFKGQSFWDPQQLFRSPQKMSKDWYKKNLMKPTDKDRFGNEGTLFPSNKFIIFVSVNYDTQVSKFQWLSKSDLRVIRIA